MRFFSNFFACLYLSGVLSAQSFSFTQQQVGEALTNLRDIEAADINGDGAPDALVGGIGEAFWFKNSDGKGNFDPVKKDIGAVNNLNAVFPVDLDGDNDLDVLVGAGSTSANSEVAWFKNLDGTGDTFSNKITLTTQGDEIRDVYAADFDGDGDQDVVFASYETDRVAWMANLDGVGTFGAPQIIFSNANGVRFLSTGDADGDGDIDIFSSSFYPQSSGQYSWYKNTDGKGTFTQVLITQGLDGNNPASIAVGDIDDNGTLDFIGTMYSSDRVYLYKNAAGDGAYGNKISLSDAFNGPFSISIADLDGDLNKDVLIASENDNKIAYLLNDGQGNFGAAVNVSIGLNFINASFNASRLIATADIDKDGDTDILAISPGQFQVVWFKNASLFAVSHQIKNPTCNGSADGAIYLNLSGGQPPYTIDWSDPLQEGDTLTGLPAGSYSVTLSESGGSMFVQTYELVQPDPLVVTMTVTPATGSQNNGTASIDFQGGTSPYTAVWSNGFNGSSQQNLQPGIYSVTVSDANGCTTLVSDTVKMLVATQFLTESELIYIYPNPTTGTVRIDWDGWTKGSLDVLEIRDAQGSLLRRIPGDDFNPAAPILLPETQGLLYLALRLHNGRILWKKIVLSN